MARGSRNIVLPSGQWKFRVGKGSVRITDPQGRSFAVGLDIITGRTWDTLERGRHKQTTDGMVTPGHVRGYITKMLSGKLQNRA